MGTGDAALHPLMGFSMLCSFYDSYLGYWKVQKAIGYAAYNHHSLFST